MHNFSLNLCNSGYSIFHQTQTFRTYNGHNFPLNLCNFVYSIFLHIQTFCTYDVHNFPLNLRNSRYLIFLQILTICTYNVHNLLWNTQFWIFNFFANLNNPYVQCTQFPVKFMLFLYSIFLQIQTIYVYNVHNFSLNLRNSGCSIFLKSSYFVHKMYTITR